jgi:predicted nucleotidyltransferase
MPTAFNVTPEKMAVYRATARRRWEQEEQEVAARRERAWELARQAATLLREQFGAKRVVAFGSLAHEAWFGPRSDVDLAAWDIPADRFFRAVAAVTGISPDFEVDLVDPADCRPALRRAIEQEGIDL